MTAHPDNIHVGIILAAGLSRRMGALKQVMPVPGDAARRPMVAMAYDALAPFCARMIVVLGHQAQAVRAALDPRPFEPCDARGETEMFESAKAGLRAAMRTESRFAAGDNSPSLLLLPGDHPLVRPGTISLVLRIASERPDLAVMPEHRGRGGHPVVIPRAIVPRILDWNGPGGLRAFWLAHPKLALREPVEDPGAVRDFDSPKDIFEK